jgi:hypothetical protein
MAYYDTDVSKWLVSGVIFTDTLDSTPVGALQVTDSFDGDGALSTNWTGCSAIATPVITAGAVKGVASSRSMALWTGNAFGADQKSTVTVTNTGNAVGVAVRGSTTADTAYTFTVVSGSVTWLEKVVGGTKTQLGSVYGNVDNGQTIGLSVVGTQLTPYINGVAQTPVTDSSIATGAPGIRLYSDVTRLDNFVGDSL